MATETEREHREEEKKKDDIVQQIYDLIEEKDWGRGVARLTIRVVFEGRLNMLPLVVNEVSYNKNCPNQRDVVIKFRS